MKRLGLAIVFLLLALPAHAASVAPQAVSAHVGQTVTVEGLVSNVHTAKSGTTFIDMGGRYPDNTFTGVIFPDAASSFPNVQSMEGKTVDITGPVRLYNGKAEIIIDAAEKLKIK